MMNTLSITIKKIALLTGVLICIFIGFPSTKAEAAVALKPPSNLGLKAYWSFNEGTSTIATDFSRNYATGTLTNFAAPASATSGWGKGRLGNGLNFDGSNDYVLVADNSNLDITGDITISVWVKPTGSFSAAPEIINKGTNGFEVEIESTGKVILAKYGVAVMVRSLSALSLDVWTHVTLIRNGATSYVYFNGVDVSDAASRSNQTFAANAVAVTIGAGTGGTTYKYSGMLDEIRIYSQALTASQVFSLYKSGSILTAISKNTTVPSGLIGLWSLDGADMLNGVVMDRSGQGHNINLYSIATSTAYVSGKIGQALYFDGTDYGKSAATTWGVTNTFTMSAWVKTAGPDGMGVAVLGRTTVTDEVMIYTYGSSIGFFASQGPGVYTGIYGSDNIFDNRWHHVVATVSGGTNCANVKLYVDGVRQTETCLSDAVSSVSDATPRTFFIGQRGTWGSCCTEAYTGSVDDVRLYNNALSTSEITQLYKTGTPTKVNLSQNRKNTTGLVGLWSFDGPDMVAGSTAYDRGSGGHDGTLSGLTAAAAVPGKVGQALYFDGTSQYIDVGNLDAYNPFSVSAWIKRARTDSGSYEGVLGCSAYNGWTFSIEDVIVHGRLFISKVGVDVVYSSGTITDLNWHHVALTYDGTNARFYIDGALDSTLSYAGRTFSCLGTYTIGNDNASSPLMGRLDDVRLYNRKLTTSEVTEIYNRTK